jgi:hypothetical protein
MRGEPRDITISSAQLGSQSGPQGLRGVPVGWGYYFWD